MLHLLAVSKIGNTVYQKQVFAALNLKRILFLFFGLFPCDAQLDTLIMTLPMIQL